MWGWSLLGGVGLGWERLSKCAARLRKFVDEASMARRQQGVFPLLFLFLALPPLCILHLVSYKEVTWSSLYPLRETGGENGLRVKSALWSVFGFFFLCCGGRACGEMHGDSPLPHRGGGARFLKPTSFWVVAQQSALEVQWFSNPL